MKSIFYTPAIFLLTLLACLKTEAATTPEPATAAAQNPAGTGAIAGKVIETMNTSDYTYLQVDTGATKVWAAAPRFAVKVGDSVSIDSGMPMEKYHSKTLDRDFEVVYFTDRVAVKGAQSLAHNQTPELPKNHPPIPGLSTKAKVDLSGIQKAEGGKTVGEIFATKTKLAGKEVKVRGKVTKFNAQIMGKNWLHIKDGTGAEGTNDLLVTTDTEVKVGDLVLVSGVVGLDKDFGANYKYAVMLENAKVTVER
jgi:hypothetical protein